MVLLANELDDCAFVCLRRAGVHVISIGNANSRHKNVIGNIVHAKIVFLPARNIAFELFFTFSNTTRETHGSLVPARTGHPECTYCICLCAISMRCDDVTLSALASYNLCHSEIASPIIGSRPNVIG